MKKPYYFIERLYASRENINRLFLYKGKSIKFSFKKALHTTIVLLLSTSFIFTPLYGMDKVRDWDEWNIKERRNFPVSLFSGYSFNQEGSYSKVDYSDTSSLDQDSLDEIREGIIYDIPEIKPFIDPRTRALKVTELTQGRKATS